MESIGVGPAFATPHLLKRFGLEIKDIDAFELNEGTFIGMSLA